MKKLILSLVVALATTAMSAQTETEKTMGTNTQLLTSINGLLNYLVV
jgi:hypothetical protein